MAGDVGATMVSLGGLLLSLLVATIVHELGHLAAARIMGIPLRLVAVGMGRTLCHRVWRGVHWELRLLPLGMSVGVAGRWDAAGRARYGAAHAAAVAGGGPLAGLLLTLALAASANRLAPALPLQGWLVATGTLSLLLTILNLLPLPGLDGGHLLLRLVELCGLRLSAQREARLHRGGLTLLAMLCMGSAVVGALARL